jgi:hypothetical protein
MCNSDEIEIHKLHDRHRFTPVSIKIVADESSRKGVGSSRGDQSAGTSTPSTDLFAPRPGHQATPSAAGHSATTGGEHRTFRAPIDLVEQTVMMLGKAVRQIELIKFLAAREQRQADLATLASHVYKRRVIGKRQLRNTRRQVELARENLVGKGCPLRLHISGNVVRLLDADPVA